jgi:hypothetical protein
VSFIAKPFARYGAPRIRAAASSCATRSNACSDGGECR